MAGLPATSGCVNAGTDCGVGTQERLEQLPVLKYVLFACIGVHGGCELPSTLVPTVKHCRPQSSVMVGIMPVYIVYWYSLYLIVF